VSWVQNVNYIAFYYRKVVSTDHIESIVLILTKIGETLSEFIERLEGDSEGKSAYERNPVETDP